MTASSQQRGADADPSFPAALQTAPRTFFNFSPPNLTELPDRRDVDSLPKNAFGIPDYREFCKTLDRSDPATQAHSVVPDCAADVFRVHGCQFSFEDAVAISESEVSSASPHPPPYLSDVNSLPSPLGRSISSAPLSPTQEEQDEPVEESVDHSPAPRPSSSTSSMPPPATSPPATSPPASPALATPSPSSPKPATPLPIASPVSTPVPSQLLAEESQLEDRGDDSDVENEELIPPPDDEDGFVHEDIQQLQSPMKMEEEGEEEGEEEDQEDQEDQENEEGEEEFDDDEEGEEEEEADESPMIDTVPQMVLQPQDLAADYGDESSASPSSRRTSRRISRAAISKRLSCDAGVQSEPFLDERVTNRFSRDLRYRVSTSHAHQTFLEQGATPQSAPPRRSSVHSRSIFSYGDLPFTVLGRTPTGALICEANGITFELVMDLQLEHDDLYGIGVQCSPDEILSQMVHEFGPDVLVRNIGVQTEVLSPFPAQDSYRTAIHVDEGLLNIAQELASSAPVVLDEADELANSSQHPWQAEHHADHGASITNGDKEHTFREEEVSAPAPGPCVGEPPVDPGVHGGNVDIASNGVSAQTHGTTSASVGEQREDSIATYALCKAVRFKALEQCSQEFPEVDNIEKETTPTAPVPEEEMTDREATLRENDDADGVSSEKEIDGVCTTLPSQHHEDACEGSVLIRRTAADDVPNTSEGMDVDTDLSGANKEPTADVDMNDFNEVDNSSNQNRRVGIEEAAMNQSVKPLEELDAVHDMEIVVAQKASRSQAPRPVPAPKPASVASSVQENPMEEEKEAPVQIETPVCSATTNQEIRLLQSENRISTSKSASASVDSGVDQNQQLGISVQENPIEKEKEAPVQIETPVRSTTTNQEIRLLQSKNRNSTTKSASASVNPVVDQNQQLGIVKGPSVTQNSLEMGISPAPTPSVPASSNLIERTACRLDFFKAHSARVSVSPIPCSPRPARMPSSFVHQAVANLSVIGEPEILTFDPVKDACVVVEPGAPSANSRVMDEPKAIVTDCMPLEQPTADLAESGVMDGSKASPSDVSSLRESGAPLVGNSDLVQSSEGNNGDVQVTVSVLRQGSTARRLSTYGQTLAPSGIEGTSPAPVLPLASEVEGNAEDSTKPGTSGERDAENVQPVMDFIDLTNSPSSPNQEGKAVGDMNDVITGSVSAPRSDIADEDTRDCLLQEESIANANPTVQESSLRTVGRAGIENPITPPVPTLDEETRDCPIEELNITNDGHSAENSNADLDRPVDGLEACTPTDPKHKESCGECHRRFSHGRTGREITPQNELSNTTPRTFIQALVNSSAAKNVISTIGESIAEAIKKNLPKQSDEMPVADKPVAPSRSARRTSKSREVAPASDEVEMSPAWAEAGKHDKLFTGEVVERTKYAVNRLRSTVSIAPVRSELYAFRTPPLSHQVEGSGCPNLAASSSVAKGEEVRAREVGRRSLASACGPIGKRRATRSSGTARQAASLRVGINGLESASVKDDVGSSSVVGARAKKKDKRVSVAPRKTSAGRRSSLTHEESDRRDAARSSTRSRANSAVDSKVQDDNVPKRRKSTRLRNSREGIVDPDGSPLMALSPRPPRWRRRQESRSETVRKTSTDASSKRVLRGSAVDHSTAHDKKVDVIAIPDDTPEVQRRSEAVRVVIDSEIAMSPTTNGQENGSKEIDLSPMISLSNIDLIGGDVDNGFELSGDDFQGEVSPERDVQGIGSQLVDDGEDEIMADGERSHVLTPSRSRRTEANTVQLSGVNIRPRTSSGGAKREEKEIGERKKRRRAVPTRSSKRPSKKAKQLHLKEVGPRELNKNLNDEGYDEGVRRSTRQRFPVLKYWRNETVRYERRLSQQLPTIEKVVVDVAPSESDAWFPGRR